MCLAATKTYVAKFPIKIERGPLIFSQALGDGLCFAREGRRIAVELPTYESNLEHRLEIRMSVLQPVRFELVEVNGFDVMIDVAGPEPPDREFVSGALASTLELARSVASDFLSWMRHEAGQPWVLATHEVAAIDPDPVLLDPETFQPLEGAIRKVVQAVGTNPCDAVDSTQLDAVLAHLAGGPSDPPLAESLLLDAQQAAASPRSNSNLQSIRRDTRQVVLLTAIASEIKIITTLRKKIRRRDRQRADDWIDKSQLRVGQLTHTPTLELLGRSLHVDKPAVYRGITSRGEREPGLFHLRNAVAHQGILPSHREAVRALRVAMATFRWLDELPARH
jgi:hypothetical protein